MKASTLIVNLQKLIEKHGDQEVIYSVDDEGNAFEPVHYEPSVGIYDNHDFDVEGDKQPNAFCIN